MRDRDLTNVQFPMLNSYPNRGRPHESERLRIAHWELNIGQILGLMRSSGYCQVIFARALSPLHSRPATLDHERGSRLNGCAGAADVGQHAAVAGPQRRRHRRSDITTAIAKEFDVGIRSKYVLRSGVVAITAGADRGAGELGANGARRRIIEIQLE